MLDKSGWAPPQVSDYEPYVVWDTPPFVWYGTVSQTKSEFRFSVTLMLIVSTLVCIAFALVWPLVAILLWAGVVAFCWAAWRVGLMTARDLKDEKRDTQQSG